MNSSNVIRSSIKAIPDYPKAGVTFRDITSLLENPIAFQSTIDGIVAHYRDKGINKIVGTESRGFIFAAPIALALGVPFVLVRKPNKLPRETITQSYSLEYGENTLEIHTDAICADDNVLIIDDLLATGGTVNATVKLIRRLGGQVSHAGFVICLDGLGGDDKLRENGVEPFSLVSFEES